MAGDAKLQVDRALESFGADLWLKRRLKLDEVIKRLEGILGSLRSSLDQAIVQDNIAFIQFLSEHCSGRGFTSDQQWSQMLNLMQISRKLNHKSVKFKDVMANKRVIESSAREIRQFNESIRLCGLVASLLEDLGANLQASQLRLAPDADVSSRSVCVDDAESRMLSEVSKSQRHLETTVMPVLHNARLHLQSELVARSDKQHQEWSSELERLTVVAERLSDFLANYRSLKKQLMQLRPLLSTLQSESADQQANSKGAEMNQGTLLLADSLFKCKQDFKRILEYDNALERAMKELSKKSQVSASASVRPSPGAPRTTNRQTANGAPLLRLKELVNAKTLALVSDIYGSRLLEALQIARQCCLTLNQVMSTLRLEFGRFYFVNDLELLTIISLDARLVRECDLEANRKLISKLFNNSIEGLILNINANHNDCDGQPEPEQIIGVRSMVGEKIMLTPDQGPVLLRKRVNIYSLEIVRILNELMRKLQRSLRSQLIKSLKGDRGEDIDWSLPIQLVSLAEQVKFTRSVESAIGQRRDLKSVLAVYEKRLWSLGKQNQEDPSDKGDGCGQVGALKRSEAISLSVHFISMLMELARLGVNSPNDWHWQKLVRCYHVAGADTDGRAAAADDIEVCVANSQFSYKFDLLPVEVSSSSLAREPSIKRLIYTKTSERCFLVASQAIGRLKFGACPYGPAGSGKTETIKALGRTLGCQVIVHNCDESNDANSLERLIWGLAHTGLWGCFDEFNRLSSDTLSSVSAVLETVQTSLRQRTSTLELEGGQIRSIDPDSAFFVTMNPGDSARYQGRRRLPANLRSLFLPIAMVSVQIDSIAREILLVHGATTTTKTKTSPKDAATSLGAAEAEQLGLKLSQWIAWMRTNLPNLNRCEWDLRLVMVLLKRFKATLADRDGGPLLNSMVNSILNEVVPRLREGVELEILHRGTEKIFGVTAGGDARPMGGARTQQLADQLLFRPGVILLTPKGSHSSRALWRAHLAACGYIKWFVLNPKSCGRSELFGKFETGSRLDTTSHNNREWKHTVHSGTWTDGLLTQLVRRSLKLLEDEGANTRQVWLIFDGPLDPDWVESLNSVLDDNQMLTLSSGERLNFVQAQSEKCIKLIFATDSIQHVSPATISRLGLICVENVATTTTKTTTKTTTTSTTNYNISGDNSEQVSARRLTTAIVDHEQVDTSCFIANRETISSEKNDATSCVIEYNCSEFSCSGNLLQVLDRTRLRRDGQTVLLINNLGSIACEDKWQTRSFVELLKFVVTYGFYYDQEFQAQELPVGVRFVVTTKSGEIGLEHESLALTACETVDLRAGVRLAVAPVSHDHSFVHSDGSLGFSLVYTQDGQTQRLLKTLRKQYSDLSSNNNNNIEICTFNSSSCTAKSHERLLGLLSLGGQTTKTPSESSKKVFLLDTLQSQLMDAKARADLYHLLNLLKITNIDFDFYMVLGDSAQPPDHEFWLSMADRTFAARPKSWNELVECSLEKRHDTPSESEARLGALVSEFVEKAYPLHEDAFKSTLRRILTMTRTHMVARKDLLSSSLDRLYQFERSIEEIDTRKRDEERTLAARQAEIGDLLIEINSELEEAKKRARQIEDLKKAQEQKTSELERNRAKTQRELGDVLPALEASKAEVGRSLKPEALNEIRTLRSPPKAIKDVLDVLFVFLERDSDTSWPAMKAYLTRASLRDELTNYNFQGRLTEGLLLKIEREFASKGESLDIERASRASSAIVPILMWIQASRRYGTVCVKLRPLTEGMQRLEVESAKLTKTQQDLERELEDLEEKVRASRARLSELEAGFEFALESTELVRNDLDRARAIVRDLQHQTRRWRSKLAQYDEFTQNDCQLLYESGLICATIACHAHDLGTFKQILRHWCGIFRYTDAPTAHHFLSYHLCMVLECADEDAALALKLHMDQADAEAERDLDQLVKILVIALNLLFNPGKVPYLHADASLTSAELVRSLAFKRILCRDIDNLVLVETANDSEDHDGDNNNNNNSNSNSNNNNGWQKKVDLFAQAAGKLLLIEVTQSRASSLLDILDYVATDDSSRPAQRVLLYDQSGQTAPDGISQLVRQLAIDSDKRDQVLAGGLQAAKETILDCLIRLREPTIGSDIARLEAELAALRRQVGQMEFNLIKALVTSSESSQVSGGAGANVAALLRSGLVRLLGDLRQSSLNLEGGLERVTSKLAELRGQRLKYETIASRAGEFYASHLAELRALDGFYHMPLVEYAHLVLDSARPHDSVDQIDWSHVLSRVVCSMPPHQRNAFRERLLAAHRAGEMTSGPGAAQAAELAEETLLASLKQAADLKSTLRGLMDATTTRRNPDAGQMALVVHEPTKSGPQLEIDELMGDVQRQKPGAWDYHVLYATRDGRLLDSQLAGLLSRRDRTAASGWLCVCVTNAHLASAWLNQRLTDFLRTPLAARLLIILIAEASDNQAVPHGGGGDYVTTSGFSSNLLDLSNLRFYYDELALKFTDRFRLYERLIEGKQQQQQRQQHDTLREITRQLVLFHVVCQELTKAEAREQAASHGTPAWEHGQKYNFDYGQLNLALGTLHRIHSESCNSASAGLAELRQTFCNYLGALVYGSRLETQADEQLLERLLDRFLGAHARASCQMATLDKLACQSELLDARRVANLIAADEL